jgi:hypothetical protein
VEILAKGNKRKRSKQRQAYISTLFLVSKESFALFTGYKNEVFISKGK